MHAQVIKETLESQTTVSFSYVLTTSATDKVNWTEHEQSFDAFVEKLARRGHPAGVKDGSGLVAAELQPGSRLEDKNVDRVTAVILDVDGKLRTNGVETITYIDPDAFLAKIPFRAVAHTSYNHSAELAKFRVIIPLQTSVPKDQYLRLWWWVYELTGRVSDPSCKNPSRMFYLPRRPREADSAVHWVRDLPGPVLSLSDVPADYQPPNGSTPPPPKKRKTGLHVRETPVRYQALDAQAVLDELLALPIYEWALSCSTELSREAWRGLATNLGAIVKDDPDMYEACSQAFHTISSADPLRYSYGDCEKAFRGAVASAQNVGPMTWSTLRVAGAPEEACADHLEKSPVAVARSHAFRKHRERTQQETLARSNGGRKGSETSIQVKEVSEPVPVPVKASESPAEPAKSDPPADTTPGFWFEPANFVFDGSTGEWVQWDSQGRPAGRMNDMSFTRILLAAGHEKKTVEDFKNTIPHVSGMRYYYDRTDRIVMENEVAYLNAYQPTDLKPVAGDWEPIRKLIANLCGDDLTGVEYVLDWLAAPLQSLQNGKPWKTLTALVFQGSQGSGKGTLGAVVRTLYGDSNTVELTQEALDGRFNDLLEGKLFVVCNEVISTNNRANETFNKIKTWITDPRINMERKYGDRREILNTFNMIFMSNDLRPVNVELGDRRYVVFTSRPLAKALSKTIWADLEGSRQYISAFYAHLLVRSTKLYKGQIYDTVARQQLIQRSMSSWDKFITLIREDGWMSVADAWVKAANPNGPTRIATEKEGFVSMTTLMAVYTDYCRSHGIKAGSSQLLAAAIKDVFPDARQSRVRLGYNPVRGWEGLPMDPPDSPEPSLNKSLSIDDSDAEVRVDYRT